MKKIYHIRKNWEFQAIINSKRQVISKNLIFYYQRNNTFKIGVSIPKKFAGAVKRNFYKRQIMAILRDIQDLTNLEYKIVMIVRKNFMALDFLEKKKEIQKMLERFKNEKRK
ncbi:RIBONUCLEASE P PROTEIN COMPONENT (PROTEIN C5) (RNASE P) [Mycoplasmopsis pulmonis]|uniref:Ribonuclease P protein component n=1 Tax=Mycoplasmopsis pulmonis (strain UAB CTIP) TaxID=272635 RepID=RNPA_MYCPU|nr:ribonuclease P protein component [Mycoplasmopsis pulmonis]Q98R57.1 RecName: Full=Ribonuclease P protein component; Short=RNase P protein; Short=RNaseP protein; AltName: Full=Protein C5 [Mycoplasmopsis pulmonis UAB CTIP]MDZ7293121.1 ribonuclease P protein component [Mycoplasmopsis pulmonis]CAC13326.1 RIBONUCLEASE P PROTEIN COMPONENT (PROTEIN C5) (RNASE P) [Mycoplasmopsis pulmonis]VEU67918.1 ribonuclease P protein component [Mycoplasmopsis pulmonis]